MNLTADCSAPVYVEIGARITKLCPFKDEVDYGTVTIGYWVEGKTLELHALRALLDTYSDKKMTHEDFVNKLAEELTVTLESPTAVTSKWETAGLCVEVSTATVQETPSE